VPADIHAVLIGVSAYNSAEFPPIRAARNSLQAMYAMLSDPKLCAWPPEQITVIANPATAPDLADQIADLAENTSRVLLVYYVGHGILSARGELCLTVTSTRPDRPKISGLAWETVAEILGTCPARTRLVILDCCFAGQAIEALAGSTKASLADLTHIQGVYTLTATTRNRTAHVPPPRQQGVACTSFTAELRDLIRSGLPGRPAQLTFGDIFPALAQRLRAKGLPAPSQRGTDTAHQFPFTANAATQLQEKRTSTDETAQTVPVLDRTDSHRAIRLLDDAIRLAHTGTGAFWKAPELARIAEVLAHVDPDRADRLIRDAERMAKSYPTDWREVRALARLAQVLATFDPTRAARILADAERIAESLGPWGEPEQAH
jgi:uncharacterized caspase-like protein